MFGNKAKIDAAIQEASQQAESHFAESLRSWHKEYASAQKELEAGFDLENFSILPINIWDEVDNESTYVYLEEPDIPDSVCFEIISHLYSFIRERVKCRVSVRYFDAMSNHPENALTDMGRKLSFKRWELFVEGVNADNLEQFVSELQSAPDYKNKPFDVYSES